MANHTRSVVIEGFPAYFGDALDWHEGENVQCLEEMEKRPTVGCSLDIMGGIMQWEAMTFDLIDQDDRIAQQIQWASTSKIKILAPSPMTSPNDTVTTPQVIAVDAATHPTIKALDITNAGGQYILLRSAREKALFQSMYPAFTVLTTIKLVDNTTDQYFFENLGIKLNYLSGDLRIYVDGSLAYSVASVLAGAWHRIGYRYNGTAYSIWLDGVNIGSHAHAAATVAVTNTYILMCDNNTNAANIKIYSKSLTDAQMLADYSGVPVADPIYDWRGRHTTHGITIVDSSVNKMHVTCISPDIARVFLPGDLLYMPLDTARVSGLVTGSGYPCQRQIYSCLEDGWRAYYQANPYPEAGSNNDYVCQAAVDRPYFYVGRMVAYYIDGVLSYIGKIENIQQNGARWTFETKSILEPFTNGFPKFSGGVQSACDWHLNYLACGMTINGVAVSPGAFADVSRGYSYQQLVGLLAGNFTGSAVAINPDYGISTITPSTDVELINDEYTKGTIAAFSTDPGVLYSRATNIHCTIPQGQTICKFGAVGKGSATLFLKWPGDPVSLLNAWFSIGEIYLRVTATGTAIIDGTDTAYIVCSVYNKDLVAINDTWGISSNSEIVFIGVPIVAGATVEQILHQLLVSTGATDNSIYDIYPGWVGLGLPASIVDIGDSVPYSGLLVCDLADGKIGEDLMAIGYGLIFEGGKFKIQKISAPVVTLATGAVAEVQRMTNQTIGVSWGNFNPVNAISYETAAGFIDVVAYSDNIFAASDRRCKSLKTACRVKLPTAQRALFVTDAFKRLQWLGNYAPTLTLTLPNHSLYLGQTVLVSVRSVAGQGRYQIVNVPALVQRIGSDYSVNLVLNTSDTSANAAWVPSWEILSYSTTTLTLKNGEGLKLDDNWTLPLAGQIIASTGQVLEAAVDIHSAVAGSVVVHTAPTYDQTIYKGILTLLNYTNAAADDALAYVWGSDAGAMSDATAGKEML